MSVISSTVYIREYKYLFVTTDNPESGGIVHEEPWLEIDEGFVYATPAYLRNGNPNTNFKGRIPWYRLIKASPRVLRTGIGHPTASENQIYYEFGPGPGTELPGMLNRMNLYPVGSHPDADKTPRTAYFTFAAPRPLKPAAVASFVEYSSRWRR